MIKIEITDPHLLDKKVLHDTVDFLLKMAGDCLIPITPSPRPVEPVPPVTPVVEPVSHVESILSEIGWKPLDVQPDLPVFEVSEVIEDTPRPSEIFGTPKAITDPAEYPDTPRPPLERPTHGDREIDVRGMPWNQRIHTRTKSKNNDGSWRYQRGISQDTIDEVEAKFFPAILNRKYPAPTPPPPPPIPVDVPEVTFQSIMHAVTAAVTAKKITRDQVLAISKQVGVPALPILASRPDLLPEFNRLLSELLNA